MLRVYLAILMSTSFFCTGPNGPSSLTAKKLCFVVAGLCVLRSMNSEGESVRIVKIGDIPSSSAKCQKHTYHISYYIQRDIEEQKYRSSCNSSRKRDWNLQKKQHET